MQHLDDGHVVSRRTDSGRHVAPGGWRRSVVGVLVGAVAGALALTSMRSQDDHVLPTEPHDADDPLDADDPPEETA